MKKLFLNILYKIFIIMNLLFALYLVLIMLFFSLACFNSYGKYLCLIIITIIMIGVIIIKKEIGFENCNE